MFSNRTNATDPDPTGRDAGSDDGSAATANRRRVRPATTAAAAAIALTVGLAAPACATDDDANGATNAEATATATATDAAEASPQPTTGETDATGETTATETNGETTATATETGEADPVREETYANRLADSIERAQAAGYLSEGDDWVGDPAYGDPVYGIISGEDGEASAEVVTIAGGTGSSPQAVLLYSVGNGNYATVAEPPEQMAGAPMFGSRVGTLRGVEQTAPEEITVTWTHPDLTDREVTYTFTDGEYRANL